jgi:hypothetical protein
MRTPQVLLMVTFRGPALKSNDNRWIFNGVVQAE